MDDPRGIERPDTNPDTMRRTWVDESGGQHAIGDCWHDTASEACEFCNMSVALIERRKVERDAEVMRQWRDGEWVGAEGARRFVKVRAMAAAAIGHGMGWKDEAGR